METVMYLPHDWYSADLCRRDQLHFRVAMTCIGWFSVEVPVAHCTADAEERGGHQHEGIEDLENQLFALSQACLFVKKTDNS